MKIHNQALIECEISILSALIVTSEVPEELSKKLLEETTKLPIDVFTVEAHRVIFGICKQIHAEGRWIDPSFVDQRLLQMYKNQNQQVYQRIRSGFFQLIPTKFISAESQCLRALSVLKLIKTEYTKRTLTASEDLENIEDIINDFEKKAITIKDLFSQDAKDEDIQIKRQKMDLSRLMDEENAIKKIEIRKEIKRTYNYSDKDTEEACQSLFADQERQAVKFYKNGLDFLDDTSVQSVGWIFPGMFPARGVSIISGDPGIGKSLLCYDIIGAFIHNEEFLGEKPVATGNVLIVASDELPTFVKDKIIDRGIDKNFAVVTGWDVRYWKDLESIIEDTMPKLVMVDSFRAIHATDPLFDENKASASMAVKKLEALSNKYGFACLLIHHNNKNTENRGVSKSAGNASIIGSASTHWLLEGTKDATVRRFHSPKIRGGAEPLSLMIAFRPESASWDVISGGAESATRTCYDSLLSWFQNIPSIDARITTEELMYAFPSHSKDAIYKSLQRLQQRGLIGKTYDKTDRKKRLYYLIPKIDVFPEENVNNLHNERREEITGIAPTNQAVTQ
jgi:predicted transcriptional regulator